MYAFKPNTLNNGLYGLFFIHESGPNKKAMEQRTINKVKPVSRGQYPVRNTTGNSNWQNLNSTFGQAEHTS